MKLKSFWSEYQEATDRVSRSVVLYAGILVGAVWTVSGNSPPTSVLLLIAIGLAMLAITLDLAQHVVRAITFRVQGYRYESGRLAAGRPPHEDDEIEVTRAMDVWPSRLWLAKLGCVSIGYLAIVTWALLATVVRLCKLLSGTDS